jgi:hypothetical protein
VCTLDFLPTIPPPPNKNHKENEKTLFGNVVSSQYERALLGPLKVTQCFGLFGTLLLFFGPKKEGTCVEFKPQGK